MSNDEREAVTVKLSKKQLKDLKKHFRVENNTTAAKLAVDRSLIEISMNR